MKRRKKPPSQRAGHVSSGGTWEPSGKKLVPNPYSMLHAYEGMLKRGHTNPCVLVLNLDDVKARRIAARVMGSEDLARCEATAREEEEAPAAYIGVEDPPGLQWIIEPEFHKEYEWAIIRDLPEPNAARMVIVDDGIMIGILRIGGDKDKAIQRIREERAKDDGPPIHWGDD